MGLATRVENNSTQFKPSQQLVGRGIQSLTAYENANHSFCSGIGSRHTDNPELPKSKRTPYLTITHSEIIEMVRNPPSVDTSESQWAILSSNTGEKARKAEYQRKYGEYGGLWFDSDTGNHSIEVIKEVIEPLACDYVIYSSRSSVEDNKKWRVYLPLKDTVSGDEFELYQEILNELFEAAGVNPDTSNTTANQVFYLPNKGESYDYYIEESRSGLDISVFDKRLSEKKTKLVEEEKLNAERLEQKKLKAAERAASGQIDYYDLARETCDFDSLNTTNNWGFKKVKKGLYISPNSDSGMPGFHFKEGKWFSHHEGDIDAEMGSVGSNGKMFGDISDLIFFFENDNNVDVVFLADFITGKTDKERKQEYAEANATELALAGFEFSAVSNATDTVNQSEVEGNKLTFSLISASTLISSPRPNDWLVKGVIERDNYGMIFGEPGSGKSLIMLDMAFCISNGLEWNGCSTKQSSVVYIAGEGFVGLGRRIRALSDKYGVSADDLYLSEAPAALIESSSAVDVAEAIADICPNPALIVIDTLHRNFGGGDENSSQDFGTFTNNIDSILRKNGVSVIVVHHTGHGNKERSRGSSSIKAALDVEYSIVANTRNQITMKCTKAKDFDKPQEQYFQIESVALDWTDEDGFPIKSAVVEPILNVVSSGKGSKLSSRDQAVLDALTTAIELHAIDPTDEIMNNCDDIDDSIKLVHIDQWRDLAYSAIDCESSQTNAKRQAFNRIRNKLRDLSLVHTFDGHWWVT